MLARSATGVDDDAERLLADDRVARDERLLVDAHRVRRNPSVDDARSEPVRRVHDDLALVAGERIHREDDPRDVRGNHRLDDETHRRPPPRPATRRYARTRSE